MEWNILSDKEQFGEINEISQNNPVLIFKHSTRCMISSMALGRLERKWKDSNIKPYFLDLIANRDVSNGVESFFGVRHESPQAILIKDGKVVFHTSHNGIDFGELNSIAKTG